MELYIIIPGIIAVIAVIVYLARRYEKKRTEALKEFAASMKFSFSKKGDKSLLLSLDRFNLFSQGHSKIISNIMTGEQNNVNVTIMEY